MTAPEDLMLQDLRTKYRDKPLVPAFERLYQSGDPSDPMFTVFHEQLNRHFGFMNQKAQANHHFNADDSRQLRQLIADLDDANSVLDLVGSGFDLDKGYEAAIQGCRGFLTPSGGSEIPEDFTQITIEKWKPIFHSHGRQHRQPARPQSYDLKMVGSGSYANVYKYVDPEYNRLFALKRAKPGTPDSDLIRFKREFETLSTLSSPYVIEVYRFNEDRHEYTMEYCDSTLRDFINRENQSLGFATRKRIALQFLYGLNYLHGQGHLHRDVSYQNALVKRFHGSVVLIKLADFGLEKRDDSELTRTESDLRGTILDPTLTSFKAYSLTNEIHSIGFVLSFIFSGRMNIDACTGPILALVMKCTDADVAARYANVLEIINAVEHLSEP